MVFIVFSAGKIYSFSDNIRRYGDSGISTHLNDELAECSHSRTVVLFKLSEYTFTKGRFGKERSVKIDLALRPINFGQFPSIRFVNEEKFLK